MTKKPSNKRSIKPETAKVRNGLKNVTISDQPPNTNTELEKSSQIDIDVQEVLAKSVYVVSEIVDKHDIFQNEDAAKKFENE